MRYFLPRDHCAITGVLQALACQRASRMARESRYASRYGMLLMGWVGGSSNVGGLRVMRVQINALLRERHAKARVRFAKRRFLNNNCDVAKI